MPLYDHYLIEDREQLDANLFVMHKALINILESTTKADFTSADNSLVQFEKSYQVIRALHRKKEHRDEQHANEHMRRHWF